MSDPKLPEYSELVDSAFKTEVNDTDIKFDQQFKDMDRLNQIKNELATEELQKIFDEVQEQEKKDFRNLTIGEFLRKLLDSLFYFLIDVLTNGENIFTAAIKDNRALFIGLDIIILLVFMKTFIL